MTATTHLVTSHGADFFGEDRHSLRQLYEIRQYVRGVGSAERNEPLVQLLDAAGAHPQEIPPATAADYGQLLRLVARSRFTPKKVAAAAALLADAADRAAAAGESWIWTPAEGDFA
jgi:hypothetical protein